MWVRRVGGPGCLPAVSASVEVGKRKRKKRISRVRTREGGERHARAKMKRLCAWEEEEGEEEEERAEKHESEMLAAWPDLERKRLCGRSSKRAQWVLVGAVHYCTTYNYSAAQLPG